jgi:hypothetical protein
MSDPNDNLDIPVAAAPVSPRIEPPTPPPATTPSALAATSPWWVDPARRSSSVEVAGFDPPAAPDAVAPASDVPVAEGERRRNPWNVVMVVVCLALVITAAALGVASRTVSSEASRARAQAALIEAHRTRLRAEAEKADRQQVAIESAATRVISSVTQVASTMGDAVDAENHLTDVTNQAADLHNQGNGAGAVQLLKTQGEPALADLTAKSAAADKAIADAQAAAQQLKGAVHG